MISWIASSRITSSGKAHLSDAPARSEWVQRAVPLILIAVAFSVLMWPTHAVAQDLRNPQSAVDSRMRSDLKVDPITHALQLQIPLAQYSQRAGGSFPVTLYYSSKLWRIEHLQSADFICGRTQESPGEPEYGYTAEYAKNTASGWTSSLDWFLWPEDISLETYDGATASPARRSSPQFPLWKIARMFVTLPDGSRHELRKDDDLHPHDEHITGRFYSVDGSRLIYDTTTRTLYLPDGSRYVTEYNQQEQPTKHKYIDRNGNTLAYDYSTNQWTDTLGRTINLPFTSRSGDVTYTLPGVGNTDLTYTFRWRQLSEVISEEETNRTLRYKGDRSHTPCAHVPRDEDESLFHSPPSASDGEHHLYEQTIFNPVVLYQIVLPNSGQANPPAYTFKYNIYGEITKIIYPTGGYERFTYGLAPQLSALIDSEHDPLYSQANRGVINRLISPDGTSASEALWQYPETGFEVIAPDGTRTQQIVYRSQGVGVAYGFDNPLAGKPSEERTFAPGTNGRMLRRKLFQWDVDGTTEIYHSKTAFKQRDPRVVKEVEINLDEETGSALAATTEYQYDVNKNVIATSRYGFTAVARATAESAQIGSFPPGTLMLTEEATFLVNDLNIDQATRDSYRARNLVALPTARLTKNSEGTVVASSKIHYDESALATYESVIGWTDPGTSVRGNATTTRRWLDSLGPYTDPNAYIQTRSQYDQCGNVRESFDALDRQTSFSYQDSFTGAAPPGTTFAYLTSTTSPAPDPTPDPTTGPHGADSGFVTRNSYDYRSGEVTSTRDANDQVTTYEYGATDAQGRPNPLLRLTKVTNPDGGSTGYEYNDEPNNTYVCTHTALDGSRKMISCRYFDGIGRAVRDSQSEGGTSIFTDTQYDPLGRVKQVSNPYRPGEAVLVTINSYDDLGRIKSVTTPDAAVVQTAYGLMMGGSVTGTTVTVTDQQGKKRRSVSDSLGRLTQVVEDPGGALNYVTDYTYDALGNLTGVQQGGQQRTFLYDSLSRLKSASNPESGVVSYVYDANGNLREKTDARTVKTTYVYDRLNRIITRSYSVVGAAPQSYVPSPQVDYFYDGQGLASANLPFSRGRLTAVKNSVSETLYTEFDPTGRIKASQQKTDGVAYAMSYEYDLAGHLTAQTYPSGRRVETAYDLAGRISNITGTGRTTPYATSFLYAPHGAIKEMRLGNGLYEHTEFNARLQPTEIRLGSSSTDSGILRLEYGYGASNNNGNVLSQKITVAGIASPLVQTYSYDELNRLQSASEEGGLSQTFAYDRFGNRAVTAGYRADAALTPASLSEYEQSTNRIAARKYDSSGNIERDQLNDGHSYSYDGENRMVEYDGGASAGGASYSYDGDGRRVKKVVGSSTTIFVYDADGQLVAEYSTQQPAGSGTSYLTADPLGTPRVITGEEQSRLVKSRHDYLPFGEEITANVNGRTPEQGYVVDDVRQKFTAKERDAETGLDYFLARYYSSVQGRFTSPDEFEGGPDELFDFADDAADNPTFYADLSNPQSLNKYQYVYNNPLALTDPDGHCPICAGAAVAAGAGVIILLSDEPANAPGIGDRTYPSGEGAAKVVTGGLFEAVGGPIISKVGGKLFSKIAGREAGREGTEIVERAMSRAELRATRETNLLRGGREGEHFVTNSVSKSSSKAQQRLALEKRPEVAVRMKVPKGKFSAPARVKPVRHPKGGVLRGGGLERKTTGKIRVKIIRVRRLD